MDEFTYVQEVHRLYIDLLGTQALGLFSCVLNLVYKIPERLSTNNAFYKMKGHQLTLEANVILSYNFLNLMSMLQKELKKRKKR